jgi:hypothetical protein
MLEKPSIIKSYVVYAFLSLRMQKDVVELGYVCTVLQKTDAGCLRLQPDMSTHMEMGGKNQYITVSLCYYVPNI